MAYWLLKTEPARYGWDDLVRDGVTAWTGVTNPQAQANLRAMRAGDRAIIYHSGEKRAVGHRRGRPRRLPRPDRGGGERARLRRREGGRAPARAGAARGAEAGARVRGLRARCAQGRLSVVPLSPAEWKDLVGARRRDREDRRAAAEEAVLTHARALVQLEPPHLACAARPPARRGRRSPPRGRCTECVCASATCLICIDRRHHLLRSLRLLLLGAVQVVHHLADRLDRAGDLLRRRAPAPGASAPRAA